MNSSQLRSAALTNMKTWMSSSASKTDVKKSVASPGQLADIALVHGFESFAVIDINSRKNQNLFPEVLSNNVNAEMLGHMLASGKLGECSLFSMLSVTNVPFGWQIGFDPVTGLSTSGSEIDELFDQLLEAYGILGGYCVPVHSAWSRRSVVVYLTERREGMRRYPNLVLDTLEHFELVYGAQPSDNDSNCQVLSDLELSCLRWRAEGKSIEDISVLLGMSEHTSKLVLSAAVDKLEAKSTEQAVSIVVQAGLIRV